jgi:hypothetical protein
MRRNHQTDFRRIFGPAHDEVAERLGSLARSTIECLGRSDALYHNYEHTLQVTMVGRDILRGLTLSQRINDSSALPQKQTFVVIASTAATSASTGGLLGHPIVDKLPSARISLVV